MPKKSLKIVIISDGTGETARIIVDAAMTQFAGHQAYFTRYKNVRTQEQIDAIFEEASTHQDVLVHTLVQENLRAYVAQVAYKKRIKVLDLIGPSLTFFSEHLNIEASSKPGLMHAVNDEYFKKIEAMEFTLNHDDGRKLESLHQADIILVGISRTSKTPLSLYLSQHGHKVVNVPMIYGIDLPKELFSADQRKIFALTIDPDTLEHIRKNRLTYLGSSKNTGEYANKEAVVKEVEWANEIFKENKRWPVFNVTDKAIEETAMEIIKLVNMRKNNMFKQKASRKDRD